MRIFERHPGYGALNRFADGELDGRQQRRVAAHLADCSRCRKEVAFIRHAGELARSFEQPPLPNGLLDRILERREAGDRVLLPLAPPGAKASPRRRVVPAAAAVVLLFAAGLFLSTGLLEADRAGLTIQPERPRPGDVLTVEYDGTQEFAGEEYLKLRARFWTATGRNWVQPAAILRRTEDDRFRAEIPLPDSVVYAAFALEDLQAENVDSNNRDLWTVAVHNHRDRPSLDGLTASYLDLRARDELGARRVAELITELYPESPRGWAFRWSIDRLSIENDSLRERYEARLQQLEHRYSEEPAPDPDELAHLAWHAVESGDWSSVAYWVQKAERRGGQSRFLYEAKSAYLRAAERPPARLGLQGAETLWAEAPFPVGAIADMGWMYALGAGDWAAAMRWLPRYRLMRPKQPGALILEQLRGVFPADRVLEWALADAVPSLTGGIRFRPLDTPRWLHQRREAESRQRVLAAVADLTLANGRGDMAAGLALEALPLAWATPALETIGSVLLATGDTANAAEAFARVAADPVGSPPPGAATATAGWAERVESARIELSRYVLVESVIRYLPAELERNVASVVAFQPACGPGVDSINDLAGSLDPAGMMIYVVPGLDPSPESLRRCGMEPPVRLDSTGEAAQAFRMRSFPSFFVTDGEGRIRFENSLMAEIPRQVAALRRSTAAESAD